MAGTDQNQGHVDDIMSTLLKRQEDIKLLDAHKTSLIEDLLARYQYLYNHLVEERAKSDLECRRTENNLQASQQNTRQLQHLLDRDPFVLVLIDGADLVFRNSLLQEGDAGGRQCATMLHQAIKEQIFSSIDGLPAETQVLVRIYADLEGLNTAFLTSGVIDSSVQLRSFARGFVQDRATFDMINVYSQGRETIIDKVEAQLKQHLFNLQCRHIILGCSDNDIYGPILKRIAANDDMSLRITLLSGVSPQDELLQLPFASMRLPKIFRNTNMEVHRSQDFLPELEPTSSSMPPPMGGEPFGVLTPPLSTPTLSVRSESRLDNSQSRATSTPLSWAAVTTPTTQSPKAMSWASTAKKALTLPVSVPEKSVGNESTSRIRRNKAGERLDPSPPEYKRDEVNRVKKIKLCNAYYLRGDCVYPDAKCTHDHYYKCTKSELETLKLVARMSACVYDTGCDDEKCIYGHNCPFPSAKEGSMRGKGCLNGEHCRFPAHMHGQDMVAVKPVKPVKMTKIT